MMYKRRREKLEAIELFMEINRYRELAENKMVLIPMRVVLFLNDLLPSQVEVSRRCIYRVSSLKIGFIKFSYCKRKRKP